MTMMKCIQFEWGGYKMEIKDLLREPLKGFIAYKPGGKKVKVRDGVQEIIQLNANENQLGPSPKAIEAMKEATEISQFYPFTFGQLEEVRQIFADYHGVEADNIMITAGSGGIISAFGEIFLNPGDEVVSCEPTYDSYKAMVNRYGAKFISAPLKDYRFDLNAMLELVTDKTKLAIIVNPNNPTGTLLTNQELDDFMEKVPEHVIVVIDEAYFEWIGDKNYESAIKYVKEGKKIAVLRTFSKLYGMAGVRIGYGIMLADICKEMRNVEWNYGPSRIGLAGAIAAIKDQEYIERSLNNNTQGREYLTKVLKEAGFDVVKSYASFIYFYPNGFTSDELVDKLGSYGVIIRAFKEYTRVSVGIPRQNEIFAETLKKVLKND